MRKSAKQSGVHGENATPGHRDSGGLGSQAALTMAHPGKTQPETQVHAEETQ